MADNIYVTISDVSPIYVAVSDASPINVVFDGCTTITDIALSNYIAIEIPALVAGETAIYETSSPHHFSTLMVFINGLKERQGSLTSISTTKFSIMDAIEPTISSIEVWYVKKAG